VSFDAHSLQFALSASVGQTSCLYSTGVAPRAVETGIVAAETSVFPDARRNSIRFNEIPVLADKNIRFMDPRHNNIRFHRRQCSGRLKICSLGFFPAQIEDEIEQGGCALQRHHW